MKSLRKIVSASVPLTQALIGDQWLLLGALFLVTCTLDIGLDDLAFRLAASPSHESQQILVQVFMAVWELVEGIFLILILSWALPKVRRLKTAGLLERPFQSDYMGSFIAEYFRALARVLLWGLLFIVPGFFRYCRLIFVPYIALFSESYRDGFEDALEMSTALTHGRFGRVMGLIILTLILGAACELLPYAAPVLHTYTARFVFEGASFLLEIWTYSLMYLLFEEAMEKYQEERAHGTHVSG